MNADEIFEHARRAFRNASEAPDLRAMRTFALAGLAYLNRADAMTALVDTAVTPADRVKIFK